MKNFTTRFKITFTIIPLFTIIITSVMDLNNSHMTNPLWPPHAKFHWAAQYFATISISFISLCCLYSKYEEKGSRFSKLFIGLSPLYFWGMFIPAILMPGTSTAPDGIIIPSNFPKLLTIVHPNFILAGVITITSIIFTLKELKKL